MFFVFLHWSSEETGKRQSKISRHFFVFSSYYLIFTMRRIVPKSDKKYIKQARNDFRRWDSWKFLVTFFFVFFCFSSLVFRGNWQETVENFSSLFCFCFSFFYFYYFLINLMRKQARHSRKFLVTFLFLFFFLLLFLYYARDSSKKWQEIWSKLGLTFQDKVAEIFLVTFFFLFFVFLHWSFDGKRQSNISRHYFVFVFVFVFSTFILYLYYAQESSKKWQEILNKLGLTFADKVVEIFSSLFVVVLFLLYLYYAQDSSKKWQEI